MRKVRNYHQNHEEKSNQQRQNLHNSLREFPVRKSAFLSLIFPNINPKWQHKHQQQPPNRVSNSYFPKAIRK